METKIQEIQEFEKNLEKYYIDNYPDTYCYDGLVDPEEYLKSDERILWILKETNGMEGMNMREPKLWGNTTFRQLVFTSYGILNKLNYNLGDWDFEDIKSKVANKIGYINLKKQAGEAKSDNAKLAKAYKIDKVYILGQLKVFNPTIIIFGYTFDFMRDDLEFLKDPNLKFNWVQAPNLGIHSTPKALLLDAYHPSQYKVTDQVYINSLVDAYISWRELYPKNQS